jgi:hypothetical protein
MAAQLSPCVYEQVCGFGRLSLSDFGTLGRKRVRLLRRVHEVGLADRGLEQGFGTGPCIRPGLAVANRRMLGTWREYAATHTSLQDCLAHFIGRLAFCRSADLRAWFVDGEVALLMWRVRNTLTPDERAAWVLAFCMPLEDDEFAQLGPALREATDTVFCGGIMRRSFCKVPFEQVPAALARRRVLMRDGWAYVCVDDAVDAAVCAFRKRLDRALAVLAPNWPDFARAEHDRLFPLVVGLSAQYVRFLALGTLLCLSFRLLRPLSWLTRMALICPQVCARRSYWRRTERRK